MHDEHLRAGRAGAAARHPAGRTVGHRQDRAWRGRCPAKSRFRSSPSTARSSTRSGSANPRRRCARCSRRRGGRRRVCCSSTPSTRSRRGSTADHFGADVYQRMLEPAAARDRQPARRQGRDPRRRHQSARARRAGALAERPVRLYRSLRQARRRRSGARSFGSAAGRCRSPPDVDRRRAGRTGRRVHRRGRRERCARRRRCWRSRNFRQARVADVRRASRDFDAVHRSDERSTRRGRIGGIEDDRTVCQPVSTRELPS